MDKVRAKEIIDIYGTTSFDGNKKNYHKENILKIKKL